MKPTYYTLSTLMVFLFVVCASLPLPAQTLTVLHHFGNGASDGANPDQALVEDANGNFYGTTVAGGTSNDGTIYKVTSGGAYTVLHSFTGADGASPQSGLVLASNGNFYGTTTGGGKYNVGVVYQMTPGGTVTDIHAFNNNLPYVDGWGPIAALIQGSDGYLYGTAEYGPNSGGHGIVFRLSTDGLSYTILHNFAYADGVVTYNPVMQASDGNLYGTCYEGGAYGSGTIYQLTLSGTFTKLYDFYTDSQYMSLNGAYPDAKLAEGTDGALYGITELGGTELYGAGVAFKITTSSTFTKLHDFGSTATDANEGITPSPGLTLGSDGNFYAASVGGGQNGYGTIYRLTPSGTLTILYSFSTPSGNPRVNADGFYPLGNVIFGSDGNLYGTAFYGGTYGYGTVFCYSLGANNPIPSLTRISPASVDAGGPAFTLTLTGTNFVSSSVAYWGSTALTTTYVSATRLTASVPSSLTAGPGSAKVTVVSPAPGGGTSSAKTFKVLQTSLALTLNSLTKNTDGSFTANISLKNTGHLAANSLQITGSTLGAAATSTTLPVNLGNLAAGASTSTSLSFPSSAGTSGSTVTLKVVSKFTGGTFTNSIKAKLP